jgi:hypothetical protein
MIFNITNEQAGNILWAVKEQGEGFPDQSEWKPLYDWLHRQLEEQKRPAPPLG